MTSAVDPIRLGRVAGGAAWAFALIDCAKAAADFNIVRVLGGMGGPISPLPMLRRADAFSAGASLLYSLTFLVTGVVVLRWIFVTNRNAQAWSPHVSVTPGWNVGWFFVPVASLLKPFEGVRETYQASVDPVEPAGVTVPVAMRVWWGAWLIGNFLGYFVLVWGSRGRTPDAVIAARWWQIGLASVTIVQAVALAGVIRRTTMAQHRRSSESLTQVFS